MTKTIRLTVVRTDVHRRIEAAGRAPVLGWVDARTAPVKTRGANVRETFDLIRKTLMERQDGTNQRAA